jgi:hypothetical protein
MNGFDALELIVWPEYDQRGLTLVELEPWLVAALLALELESSRRR